MSKLQADFSLVIVTLAAAAGWIFSKSALQELPPFLFLGARFILAATVLSFFCYRQLKELNQTALTKGLITGSLFAVAIMTWVVGLNNSEHVGQSSFIVSLGILFVPLFSRLFLNEIMPNNLYIAIPTAIAGLAYLNLEKALTSGLHWDTAQLTLITAAMLFALQFVLTAHLTQSMNALVLTTLQLWVSGIISLVTGLVTEDIPQYLSANTISNVIAAAIVASCLRFYLQTLSLKSTTAAHAGMILLLEPVWVTILGYMVLAQTLNKHQILGCTLIFSALLITRIKIIK